MKRTRIVTAVLVVVLATPLVVDMFLHHGGSNVVRGSLLEVRQSALEDRVRQRRQQRQYWQAVEIIQERRAAGEDLTVPNINDYPAIVRILKGERDVAEQEQETAVPEEEQNAELHGAAPQQASSLMVTDLNESDRHLLRRYSKANSCPNSLKDYIPGFYELCLSLTENATHEPRVGLMNAKAQVRSVYTPPAPTLKFRLQMIQEAYDHTNRRTDVVKPFRPVNTINQ